MARLNIAIWPGSGSAVSASTPFGLYDNDTIYQLDAPKVADFCAQKLGYPITDIEMQSKQLYACLEESVTEYSAQVNQFRIRETMLDLKGYSTGSSLTGKEITTTLGPQIAIAETYGTEAGSGGNVTYKSGSVTLVAKQQAPEKKELVQPKSLDQQALSLGITPYGLSDMDKTAFLGEQSSVIRSVIQYVMVDPIIGSAKMPK